MKPYYVSYQVKILMMIIYIYGVAGLNDKKTEESSLYCCYEHQPSVAIIFIATTFLVI